MNHSVTVGDILASVAILAGLTLAGFGLIELLAGGMSDDPSTGDSAGRQGFGLGLLGVAVVVVAALLLAACAHAPQVRVETVTVDVPVAVQPIKPSDIPAPPPPLGPRPPTAQQAADAAFAGWCAAVAYIVRSVPLLSVSAGLPAAQAPTYPECAKH